MTLCAKTETTKTAGRVISYARQTGSIRKRCENCKHWDGKKGDEKALCYKKPWGVAYDCGTHVSHWSTGRECVCLKWELNIGGDLRCK
jgi:hypothetical protein